MKAKTYYNKIKTENACSIATAENFTKALHREGLLDRSLAIRFRPLFCDFDIVNSDFTSNRIGVTSSVKCDLDDMKELFGF